MLSLEYITNFSMMLSRKKKLQILSVYSYVKISVYFGPTKSEVYFFITVKKKQRCGFSYVYKTVFFADLLMSTRTFFAN